MAYRKQSSNSRRYKRHENHAKRSQNEEIYNGSHAQPALPAPVLALPERTVHHHQEEPKQKKPLGFLGSFLNPKGSGKALFTFGDYEIHFDDLLLVGLIVLLMTDGMQDEVLVFILLYLLLDIF